MVRKIVAAMAGIATAVGTVMLMEWISHRLYPPPAGLDTRDPGALAEHMANAPAAALVFVAVGYIIATFDGILVAVLISRDKPGIYAGLIGLLMLVATVSTLLMIPHPAWFQVLAVAGIVAAAFAGMACGRVFLRNRAVPA